MKKIVKNLFGKNKNASSQNIENHATQKQYSTIEGFNYFSLSIIASNQKSALKSTGSRSLNKQTSTIPVTQEPTKPVSLISSKVQVEPQPREDVSLPPNSVKPKPKALTPPPKNQKLGVSTERVLQRPQVKVKLPLSEELEKAKEPKLEKSVQTKRYQDKEQIGEGGTAFVYKARDLRLKRDVALKRFKNDGKSNNQLDYLAELESASRISHHNVVSTFDADVDEQGQFIVMEFIEGTDAEILITKQEAQFNIKRFVDFAIQALEGLEATHKGGLIHLDIKPSNIMISQQLSGRDVIKIVDYGRAELIKNDEGLPPKGQGLNGSIHYLSPEQLLEKPLDIRSDLYSMGCVFYWILTSQCPFEGDSAMQVMASHLQNKYIPLSKHREDLPEWLTEWVSSFLFLDKEKRPISAKEGMNSLLISYNS